MICSPASATGSSVAATSKVQTPGSRLRASVLDVLKSEGYIRDYATTDYGNGRTEFEIELKYYDGQPVIRSIQRVSKPGRRVYSSVGELPRVADGLGITILSTPQGVMSDHEARERQRRRRSPLQGVLISDLEESRRCLA